VNNDTPTPIPAANPSSFGAWRRPLILVFAVTILAISSPFVYIDGVNKESTILTVLGQIGIAVSILTLFVLPFLPKRFGFRLYDFLAILIALIFAAIQAPGMQRTPSPEQDEPQTTISEEEVVRLANQLQQYATEQGPQTLADFFLNSLGQAEVTLSKDTEKGTTYEAKKGKYLLKLVILPVENAGTQGFTFTALAAPNVDMKSFFIDKNGENIPLNAKMPL
jgi:hypothetical protein